MLSKALSSFLPKASAAPSMLRFTRAFATGTKLAKFDFEDPLQIEDLFTEEEKMVRDSARQFAQEKLLDKLVAVVNTRVISLSEIDRIQQTLPARQEVSPMIYSAKKYSEKELLDILINAFIIRDKINAQGYVINDDAVESRIKMTEERLGLKRSDLLNFLKTKNLTFEEYFELVVRNNYFEKTDISVADDILKSVFDKEEEN
jgi:hypothetical protein